MAHEEPTPTVTSATTSATAGAGSATTRSADGVGSTGVMPGPVALFRALTAAAVLLSAVIHVELWFEGYRDLEFIGPAFMVNAVAGLVIATLVLAWRTWWPLLAAVAFGAATLTAFILSATVGLFDVRHQVMDTPQVLSVVAESAAIVCALVAGGLDRGDRRTTTAT